MHLNDDWNEFLRALTSTGTRYLLIGGHALAVHAEPRFTEDLDVFVQPSLANARLLRKALVEFGFGSVMPEAAELAKRRRRRPAGAALVVVRAVCDPGADCQAVGLG